MSRSPKEAPIHLTLGSRYHLRSLASREAVLETRGIFRGFVGIGSIDGVAMELDDTHAGMKGQLRVIPSHMVVAIDIVEAAKTEDETVDDTTMHYT